MVMEPSEVIVAKQAVRFAVDSFHNSVYLKWA
jgi:hypothetical protein